MRVIVTGSSRGIGRAIAEEFLSNGHEVFGIDMRGGSISHDRYKHIVADIASDTLPEIEGCQILINNAGVQNTGKDIDINLKATMALTEKYAMQDAIKSVLFIASSSARTGAEFPEYAASKGGILAYMKNVASRIAKYGAVSNSLSPGGVISELNDHIISDENLYEQVLNETMLHKWATCEEIAKWAYFVAAVNKSMTSQDILIDNGEDAKTNFIW